jgi:hypothetical protein
MKASCKGVQHDSCRPPSQKSCKDLPEGEREKGTGIEESEIIAEVETDIEPMTEIGAGTEETIKIALEGEIEIVAEVDSRDRNSSGRHRGNDLERRR